MRQRHRSWAAAARGGVLILAALCCAGARAQDGTQAAAAPSAGDADKAETVPTIPVTELRPAAAVAEAAPDETQRLDEIVVTATKRAKPLRAIPASISVLDGEALASSGAQGQQDFLRLVPGVNFENYDFGSSRITIRGISAVFNGNQTTGVLLGDVSFVDVYLPRVALDPNPFDMQSVEVLKGPQGTLFGASTLNGAIRYVPEPPQYGVSELKYFVQYTSVNEGGGAPVYGGALNVPLGEAGAAAVRLVAFRRESPGYIDDLQQGLADVNSLRQDGLRAMGAWEAGARGAVSLMYTRQQTEKADASYADNYDGRLSRNNSPRQSPSHSFYDLANLGLRYDFDGARLISETAFVRKRYGMFFDLSRITNGSTAGSSPQPSTIGFTDENRTDTFSQELRLASPDASDSPWQWVGGIFGTRQTIYDDRNFPVGEDAFPAGTPLPISALTNLVPGAGGLVLADGQPNAGKATSDLVMTEYALFGEVARRLFEDWEITLGGRYYRTRLGGTVSSSGALYQSFNQTGAQAVNRDTVSEKGLNPKLSLAWSTTPALRAFAAAARGFRVGGLQPPAFLGNPTFQAPAVFKSDTIWNYELGLRTQWLDDRLRLDLTGFHVQWDDPQLLQVTAGNLSSYVDNVGGVKSTGVEFASVARLPFGLTLNAAVVYAETVTTEPFTTSGGVQTEPGTTWPLAPRWQTATTLDYRLPLGEWNIGASVTHTYTSQATAYLLQGAVFDYQQWDAGLRMANPAIEWLPELSLTVANLADVRGVTSDQPVPQFSFNDVTYVTPRSITLRLGGRF